MIANTLYGPIYTNMSYHFPANKGTLSFQKITCEKWSEYNHSKKKKVERIQHKDHDEVTKKLMFPLDRSLSLQFLRGEQLICLLFWNVLFVYSIQFSIQFFFFVACLLHKGNLVAKQNYFFKLIQKYFFELIGYLVIIMNICYPTFCHAL